MVLEIHGGPAHAPTACGFFHEFQMLAARRLRRALHQSARQHDATARSSANVIQYRYPGRRLPRPAWRGVDDVIARGYVDPERLGVTGGSGGGLLTNWIVTQTDRFAAAVTERCVADWASFYYSCRLHAVHADLVPQAAVRGSRRNTVERSPVTLRRAASPRRS